MTHFEVRGCELPDGPSAKMNYAKLAMVAIEKSTPPTGLTFAEQANRFDLRRLFKDAKEGDIIKLNDADVELLRQCVNVVRWIVLDEEIVTFGKYVMELTPEPEPAADAPAPSEKKRK